ncbi:hypothetical protein [Luteimonas huabeiensis]|uniref:hypothetical protein n=1 Tax=Luteimonas huabeiensis TaxID=1244513 RepID=UPI000463C3EA|nr:hypothetical protein [Luteimonas huabeiensis]
MPTRRVFDDPKSRPRPWQRDNPKPKAARTRLSAAQREAARARASDAGRRYPNLIDNLWAASALDARGRPRDERP